MLLLAMMTLFTEHTTSFPISPHSHHRLAVTENNSFLMLFAYVWLCCGVIGAIEHIASIDSDLLSEARLESQHRFYFGYRMSYESFHVLLDRVRPLLPSSEGDFFVREPIAPELALASVLWRLAHGHSSRNIAESFGIGESTIRKYTTIICRILNHESFFFRYGISVPRGERLTRIMADYAAITGLPHIAGAIDGTHIRLQRKPAKEFFPAEYTCRHGFPSILLQGIVDPNKLFWSVVCRAPGGEHDYTHFKDCHLYGRLKRGEVLDQPLIEIEGENIRPYLVADYAYKAKTFLVKPYCVKHGEFAVDKREFGKKLSLGRIKVENAFGLLKNRWRILQNVNVDLSFAPTVVGACCLLHNFVQLRGEAEPDDQQDPHPNSEEPLPSDGGNSENREMALRVREALFRHSSLPPPQ